MAAPLVDLRIEGDAEVRRTLRNLTPELARRAIQAGAQAAFNTAQDAADSHTVTGALARSVRLRPVDGGYVVEHDLQAAPHAVFVHWGTRPHVIEPKDKKALRWPVGGGFAFAKRVNHPGYAGDPYMVRARDEAVAAILRIVGSTRP